MWPIIPSSSHQNHGQKPPAIVVPILCILIPNKQWMEQHLLLRIVMGTVKPVAFPKQVTRVWVWLSNLDTAQNCVPLPRYCRYKQVCQPRVSTQLYRILFSKYCRVVIYSEMTCVTIVTHCDTTKYGSASCMNILTFVSLSPIPSHIKKQSKLQFYILKTNLHFIVRSIIYVFQGK